MERAHFLLDNLISIKLPSIDKFLMEVIAYLLDEKDLFLSWFLR